MALISTGTTDVTTAGVQLQGGLYQLSVETAGAASVKFDTRQGESGVWHPVQEGGADITLTGTSGNKNVRLPGSIYIRATIASSGAVTYTITATSIEE
jgi:hypothetical protein